MEKYPEVHTEGPVTLQLIGLVMSTLVFMMSCWISLVFSLKSHCEENELVNLYYCMSSSS